MCPDNLLGGDGWYINPGIKFGHTFREGGGATVGIEVSYSRFGETSFGVLASVDYCKKC